MSLHEQIGGEAAVDAVVDRFYDIMLQDPRVSPIFAKTNMERQRKMQKSFMNHVLGGKEYNGKSMRAAHKHLKLTDDHFNAVAENLMRALRELGVKEEHISQIMAVVETTRDDVLGREKPQ